MMELTREGSVFVLRMNDGENRFNPEFVRSFNAALDEAAPSPDAPLPEPDPAESDSETPSPGADDAG